ncbi:MAG: prephenate dehydrogenase [Gammaproteobacteria bacterium SG8_11]|nr:MAG: prephenate dehydrogenase [Gammaproteobacteria bacterium SG8_11]
MINRLSIIGVGLIGGSLARALKKANAVGQVVGYGRNIEHLQKALELGVVDKYETDIAVAVRDADVIVLAVPVGKTLEVLQSIKPYLNSKTIITDVGSSKGAVVKAAREVFGDALENFVPGHPIAGTEKSGVEASFAELFENRRVVLTPLDNTNEAALKIIRRMWQDTGALVEQTSVEHHDDVLAATSHLPHMLAFALVDALATMDDKIEIFRYAAGGFRDFTRIASSDPQMWHDICVTNEKSIVAMLDLFMADLERLRDAIKAGDSDYLLQVFTRAKKARDQFSMES